MEIKKLFVGAALLLLGLGPPGPVAAAQDGPPKVTRMTFEPIYICGGPGCRYDDAPPARGGNAYGFPSGGG